MRLFRKKPSPQEISDKLGPLLVQAAVMESVSFQDAWRRELDDRTQAALFAEFLIFLIAYADRLAFGTFGDPVRSQIMNSVVDTAQECFANQRHFGSTSKQRGLYFETLCNERLVKFSSCSSVMGGGVDSLAVTGAGHLVETFLSDLPESQLPTAILETSKVVSKSMIALMIVPSFKAITQK